MREKWTKTFNPFLGEKSKNRLAVHTSHVTNIYMLLWMFPRSAFRSEFLYSDLFFWKIPFLKKYTLNCCNEVNEGSTLWFKFKCKAALLKVESEILRDMPCLPFEATEDDVSKVRPVAESHPEELETGKEHCPDEACNACNLGCCPPTLDNIGIGRWTWIELPVPVRPTPPMPPALGWWQIPELVVDVADIGNDKGDGMSSKWKESRSSSCSCSSLEDWGWLIRLIIANSSRIEASSSALASPLNDPKDFFDSLAESSFWC